MDTEAEYDKYLRKAQEGDIQAFHSLYAEFQSPLKGYLYRLVANRNDTEDLAHDVFIKAFENLKGFRGEASLKNWVFTIATNHARRFLKNRNRWREDTMDQSRMLAHREEDVMKSLMYASSFAPQGTYEVREHIDYCFTCTGQMLALEQQIALLLKDVFRFSIKEIAGIMELSEASIKHHLHNARSSMQDIFEHNCALVSKTGVCDQCSQLNGKFNPKQDAREKLMQVKMWKDRDKHGFDKARLYALRTKLVQGIDPLFSSGADLHEVFLGIAGRVNE